MKQKIYIALATILSVIGIIGIIHTGHTILPVNYQPQINSLDNRLKVVEANPPQLGSTIPVIESLFETSLAAGIGTNDSSMTLALGTDRAGNALSGYMCFTVDSGTATVEYICGTASSTSITSLVRGIDPITGTTTVASLQFAHRRGADVKITDYPTLGILSRILNGNDTLPNPISYASTQATSSFTTYNLPDKQYVDGVALQGAPTATGSTPGIIQLATSLQTTNGTAMSGGYTLVAANSLFNQTPQSATTVPVTLSNGKLAQGFFDLSQAFTFTGAVTINSATTTLAATTTKPLILNGISYSFPNSQGAASSTLVNNGSGTLAWINGVTYATSTSINQASSWGTSATTVAMTLVYTPPAAGRVMVTYLGFATTGTTVGDSCTVSLYIDKSSQSGSNTSLNGISVNANSTQGNLSFTFITSQLTAAQHTFDIAGQGGGHTCTGTNNQMSIIYLGN